MRLWQPVMSVQLKNTKDKNEFGLPKLQISSRVSIKWCVKVTQVANTMRKVTLVRQQAEG